MTDKEKIELLKDALWEIKIMDDGSWWPTGKAEEAWKIADVALRATKSVDSNDGESSKGRTPGLDPVNLGSIPSSPV